MKNTLTLLALALLASQPSQAAVPVCGSNASDPDGDGWGWEQNSSCRVAATPAVDQSMTPLLPAAPTPEPIASVNTPLCVDPDGDGWGWDGTASCRIDAGEPPATGSGVDPSPSAAVAPVDRVCIDTDPVGDGWGWDGAASCRIEAAMSALTAGNSDPSSSTVQPLNEAICTDTDPVGDGWGWDGVSACQIEPLAPASAAQAVCIDTDPVGDGWGWNGVTSCQLPATPLEAALSSQTPAPREAECVDTDPVGDGWGWNGVTACQLAIVPLAAAQSGQTPPLIEAAECIDTAPVGDGWGWDGSSVCVVENASSPGLVGALAQRWQLQSAQDQSRPTARHEAGAVGWNNKIYLLGGRGERPVEVYDADLQQWYQLGSLPMEMHHFQPVIVDNKLYVLGAFSCCFPVESAIANVWVMDIATGTWTADAPIPPERRRGSAAAAVYDGKIYLVGGNTRGHSGGAVAWFDEFDPATGKWQRLADAPRARDHAGAAVINGQLVISSGRRTAQPDTFGNTVAATDVYDFSTGRWSAAAAIPTQRGGAMVTSLGDELIVIGGESNVQFNAHDEVEAFSVRSKSWRNLPSLNVGRHSGGVATLDGGVHVVSGAANRGGSSEIQSHERLATE